MNPDYYVPLSIEQRDQLRQGFVDAQDVTKHFRSTTELLEVLADQFDRGEYDENLFHELDIVTEAESIAEHTQAMLVEDDRKSFEAELEASRNRAEAIIALGEIAVGLTSISPESRLTPGLETLSISEEKSDNSKLIYGLVTTHKLDKANKDKPYGHKYSGHIIPPYPLQVNFAVEKEITPLVTDLPFSTGLPKGTDISDLFSFNSPDDQRYEEKSKAERKEQDRRDGGLL